MELKYSAHVVCQLRHLEGNFPKLICRSGAARERSGGQHLPGGPAGRVEVASGALPEAWTPGGRRDGSAECLPHLALTSPDPAAAICSPNSSAASYVRLPPTKAGRRKRSQLRPALWLAGLLARGICCQVRICSYFSLSPACCEMRCLPKVALPAHCLPDLVRLPVPTLWPLPAAASTSHCLWSRTL